MVFIRKNRNFNTKRRFSCRKQQFTSIIVLYSGKLSFYQEKGKFYVENDVFQTKNIRNAVLQWKILFLSGKTEILNTKTRFSCRKQQLTSIIVLYSGKLSFYQKKRKFYLENDVFQRKFFRNAVLQWRRWFLSGKTEILTRKRGFLVENSSLHLKQYFIVENSVFIRRNENLTSKTMFSFLVENREKQFQESVFIRKFYSGEAVGFYQEKQKF